MNRYLRKCGRDRDLVIKNQGTSRHSRTHGKPFIRDRLCRVGNTLTTTDNKSNDNTVAIPTYYTRYTMGPRVREDDKIRDRKRLIDRS